MPGHLQYTLQRSQPFSALSYPIPKTLLLPSTGASAKSVGSNVRTMPYSMAPSAQAYSKPEYITKDYYSQARTSFSASSSDSGSDSNSDDYDSSDEFCFDDIESRSPKSTLNWSRASTSSSMASPLLCTCDKQVDNKSSLTVGDFTFENQSDYNEYNDLVRLQTRNAAKRRTSFSRQQTSISQQPSHVEQARGRRRQRHLHKLEEQDEESSPGFGGLTLASSVSGSSHSSRVSSDYTSSFEPALLAAKLNALLVTSPEYSPTFPSIDSLPSLHLDSGEDEYATDEETDIEEEHELTKMQARDATPRPALEAESRFERALAFAKWNKRGRAGVWESPEGVSETVRELIASIEMHQ